MSDLPLISCIMPTFNRGRFIPRALKMFLAQTYPNKELVVVDDSDDDVTCDFMLPIWQNMLGVDGPKVKYVRLSSRLSIGEKRNIACERANGSIITHFDDDDWQDPGRIAAQVVYLRDFDLTGVDAQLYYRPVDNTAWRYTFTAQTGWYVIGNSFMYRREFWETHPFEHVSGSEDGRFIMGSLGAIRVKPTRLPLLIGLLHGTNVSPKETQPPFWQPAKLADVRSLMGAADFEIFSRSL